ncbi:hypothetical protein DQ04_02191110 [Trypanosoma grayi]|uniref:hypothetical protein n=1 Tax=Trypanosoma grayi TaxID=71804 RepID=UPI0004F3F9F7|nr:hypothetical protein DQ04_02191110 [Trypanosoma grayi]KEG11879.1 hypothetical protein DQ04_02191110 [Trypanosoma grayi]
MQPPPMEYENSGIFYLASSRVVCFCLLGESVGEALWFIGGAAEPHHTALRTLVMRTTPKGGITINFINVCEGLFLCPSDVLAGSQKFTVKPRRYARVQLNTAISLCTCAKAI